jgi:2-polyprenyl-3-methyl-5-hydroxy-6-metoxy-1,4-benzoquinol methylase
VTDVDPNWFDGFFEHEWLDEIALHLPDEGTQGQVDFVVERLELEPGARVLDVACGHGRHSLELARRGFRVTGVDLGPRSLELAREAAKRESLEVAFVHRDARELDFDAEFDAAINLFTSVIGYFEDEADTQEVLNRVARALVPGGSFLLDTVNAFALGRRYQEAMWNELESGGVMLHRGSFDLLKGRNDVVWTFLREDGSRSELRHSLRVYTPHELARMLETAGLTVVGSWGGFDGVELAFDTWRLILRGDKA